jgi:lipoprotein-anchoring transpeptidase ErfK/SrfK
VLYRPKYFTGGVAVHGFPDVPPYAASHGCVRVTNAAMDWLWATGRTPIGRPVWVY